MEKFSLSLAQRSTAEFIGTFWLVLGGCGSAVLSAAFPNVGIGLRERLGGLRADRDRSRAHADPPDRDAVTNLSVNPARSTDPAVFVGGWALGQLWLFWVLHFWHFGNQDFGVLSLYRSRAGQTRMLDRRVDKLYTVLMMFLIQPLLYLCVVKTTAFAEIVRALLPLPNGLLERTAPVALALATVASLAVAGFEIAKPNRSPGKLLYIIVILLHPLLLYGSVHLREPRLAYLYLLAYLWSHWFIAIGLVGRINARHYQQRGDSRARSLGRHALLLGAITGAVWLLTHPYTEYGLFNTDGFRYKPLLAQIGPTQTLVIGLVLGFFLAEQLLHYYCDRCLFRFRDEGVRRAVAPLL